MDYGIYYIEDIEELGIDDLYIPECDSDKVQ